MTYVNKSYLGIKEGNKILRKHLARVFPGVKFSVRGETYAGGSSTNIRWTDGPLASQVEAVAKPYGSKGFDGMIDMQYSYSQWLTEDGRIVCAGTSGTEGSRGTVASFHTERPVGAVPVSSGIGYAFCRRDYSVEFYTRAVECVCRKYGVDVPPITYGSDPYIEYEHDVRVPNAADQNLATLVYRHLVKRTTIAPPFNPLERKNRPWSSRTLASNTPAPMKSPNAGTASAKRFTPSCGTRSFRCRARSPTARTQVQPITSATRISRRTGICSTKPSRSI